MLGTLAFAALATSSGMTPAPQSGPVLSYEKRFEGKGEAPAQRALAGALAWLAGEQRGDGSWPSAATPGAAPGAPTPHEVGVTALALLALLGDGNTPERGPYKRAVAAGVRWLASRQDAGGLVGEPLGHAFLYDHAIATIALCEAAALAPSPEVTAAAQDAVACALRARNPYSAWRYDVPPVGDNDTSVTGWMVAALKAAEAARLKVDGAAFDGALSWIDGVTDPATSRVGYDTRGSMSSRVIGINDQYDPAAGEALTAVGLATQLALGRRADAHPILDAHAELILGKHPRWDRAAGKPAREPDHYFWYWGTLALAREGGERWDRWNAGLEEVLLATQVSDGELRGSWDPDGPWGYAGGRVYSTALLAMCVEAPYRFDVASGSGTPVAAEPPPPARPPRTSWLRLDARRSFEDRARARDASGGAGTERALDDALAWLARHQSSDGSWDADAFSANCPQESGARCEAPGDARYDIGVSGLALLALLGAGNTPSSGPYKAAVRDGLAWLRRKQDAETGLIGGQIGHTFLYQHAIATLALCEALALEPSLEARQVCRAAVATILRARNPYGAWRYDLPPAGDNDTSVTGWMMFALEAAKLAGLEVDEHALRGAGRWIDEVTDVETGRVGYDARGSSSSRIVGINDFYPVETGEAMTAVGLACRFLLGQEPDRDPVLGRHAQRLLARLPEWNASALGHDMYYWYYGTIAMRWMGGEHWERWNAALKPALLDSQRTDGHAEGSWDPIGPWGVLGGRVYSTALLALCLESYYRYAPPEEEG